MLAAAVQLTSTSNEEASLQTAEALVREAAAAGATLVVTPEATNYLGPHHEKVARATTLEGPLVARFSALAAELRITLVLGSFNERSPDPTRAYNTSVTIGPDGAVLGVYRKIHLFDVDVQDGPCFRESDTAAPGDEVVIAQSPAGPLGLSICYDLRFPELYRALVDAGAQILTVPSAFTLHTGKDHWTPLLQARAIECQSYVIAAGQYGEHDDQGLRRSYGHSMIVDPWGHVIAMASDGPGIALASVDLDRVQQVRRAMPLASHRRL